MLWFLEKIVRMLLNFAFVPVDNVIFEYLNILNFIKIQRQCFEFKMFLNYFEATFISSIDDSSDKISKELFESKILKCK
jgi:hypothetical protein